MLNKEIYEKMITGYLEVKSFEASPIYLKTIYEFIKNKISNDQFKTGMNKVIAMSNERYFNEFKGKKLSPENFLIVCNIKTINEQLESKKIQDFNSFLKKVKYYWTGFLTEDDRDDLKTEFNQFEKHILSLNGEIGGIRQAILNQKNGAFGKTQEQIIKKLKQDFNDNYGKDFEDLQISSNVKAVLPKMEGLK